MRRPAQRACGRLDARLGGGHAHSTWTEAAGHGFALTVGNQKGSEYVGVVTRVQGREGT